MPCRAKTAEPSGSPHCATPSVRPSGAETSVNRCVMRRILPDRPDPAQPLRWQAPAGSIGGVRIATWNVNSVKARLPRLVSWLADRQPDVLLVQETKATEESR